MSMIPITSTNPVLQGGASHSPLCLYVGDWYADTSMFNATERGAYISLLMHLHNNGGVVRDDYKKLAKITGLSESKWIDVERIVLEKFTRDYKADTITHYTISCIGGAQS